MKRGLRSSMALSSTAVLLASGGIILASATSAQAGSNCRIGSWGVASVTGGCDTYSGQARMVLRCGIARSYFNVYSDWRGPYLSWQTKLNCNRVGYMAYQAWFETR